MSIKDALSDAADAAKLDGRPLPVIYTDRVTGLEIAKELSLELGCRAIELQVWSRKGDAICMYDGIAIKELKTYDPKADRQFLSVWKSRLRAAFSRS